MWSMSSRPKQSSAIQCAFGITLLVTGTPQQIKDYVKELIDIFGDIDGLIADGAVDGVLPESRAENVEAMTKAVFEYGVY